MQTVVAAALTDRGFEVTREGLSIQRVLSFEEWRACGIALAASANRVSWAIGDWLVYGSGRGDYGEYYMEAQEITGRSFHSLSQCARVSKTFTAEQRHIAVPWTFYRESLRLPEDQRIGTLELALQNHWTRDGLAEFISTRDGSVPSTSRAISVADVIHAGTTRESTGAKGWKPAKSHHNLMQCPSCGFKFEPKRRQKLRSVKSA